MSFKIWGKSEIMSEVELKKKLETMFNNVDVFTLIQDIIKKGSAVVGNTKILALKFK